MILFKLGGSLLTLPNLAARLDAVIQQRPGRRLAVVVGGGGPADLVRKWDRLHGLGAEAAHALALKAMALSTALAAQLLPGTRVVDDDRALRTACDEGELPLVNAAAFLERAEQNRRRTPPHTWQTTSDTIAAWLAHQLHATELVLLKSVDPPGGGPRRAAADGLVDACFAETAAGLPRISWVNVRSRGCVVHSWFERQHSEVPHGTGGP